MVTDDRLLGLLERWETERDIGRVLSVAELCRDCPELLHEADAQIAVLRRFHALSEPAATTSIEVRDQAETATTSPLLRSVPWNAARSRDLV